MNDVTQARERMLADQFAKRGIVDPRVLEAFRQVPRELFVDPELRARAYDDCPLPIADGQTISQPYIVALMLQAAAIAPTDRVLEIGAGCGYSAALLGHLAGRKPAIPIYVCTGRHTLAEVERLGLDVSALTIVADTCIVVTPILPGDGGLLLTNSGKFAHYTRPNTGFDVLYGSLADCAETAVAGRLVRDEGLWR